MSPDTASSLPMGRRAKYHTDAERKKARREQKARYAQSSRCVDIAHVSLCMSAAYQSYLCDTCRGHAAQAAARARHAQKKVTSAVTLDDIAIPDALRAYATMPFVMSFAFLDTTGPALGLRHPPFMFRMPDRRSLESLERRGSRDPLLVKLESLQYTWALSAGSQRKVEWAGKAVDVIARSGARELAARVCAWVEMERRMPQLGEGDAAILDVAMRWGARLAMTLAEELQLKRRGEEAWVETSRRGELPLQRLVRENRLRIEGMPTEDEESENEE